MLTFETCKRANTNHDDLLPTRDDQARSVVQGYDDVELLLLYIHPHQGDHAHEVRSLALKAARDSGQLRRTGFLLREQPSMHDAMYHHSYLWLLSKTKTSPPKLSSLRCPLQTECPCCAHDRLRGVAGFFFGQFLPPFVGIILGAAIQYCRRTITPGAQYV